MNHRGSNLQQPAGDVIACLNLRTLWVRTLGITLHFSSPAGPGRAVCADEDEAKERALRPLDGKNLELWQGDRRIAESKRREGGQRPIIVKGDMWVGVGIGARPQPVHMLILCQKNPGPRSKA